MHSGMESSWVEGQTSTWRGGLPEEEWCATGGWRSVRAELTVS